MERRGRPVLIWNIMVLFYVLMVALAYFMTFFATKDEVGSKQAFFTALYTGLFWPLVAVDILAPYVARFNEMVFSFISRKV